MKEDDSGSDSEDDMEKAMAKEASEIKAVNPAGRRFQNVDCKAKNCIFIKTTLDNPCDLTDAIFEDLIETKVQKARYAIRMMPVAETCKAVMKNIEETAEKLFKPHFATEFGVGVKYTSVCKIRNNNSVSRTAILPSLGKIIRELNPLHMLCHDEPDLVVLIEVIRNICCLSVIKNFFRFKKCNLHEVVKSSETVLTKTLGNPEEAKTANVETDTKTANVETDTKTANVETDTKTASVETDTKTANVETDTKTANVETDTKTANVETDKSSETDASSVSALLSKETKLSEGKCVESGTESINEQDTVIHDSLKTTEVLEENGTAKSGEAETV